MTTTSDEFISETNNELDRMLESVGQQLNKDNIALLTSVIDITYKVTSILSLDRLVPASIETISRNLTYSHVATLFMARGNRLVLGATSGESVNCANYSPGTYSIEIGRKEITGWVAATGQSVLMPDVRLDPRTKPINAPAQVAVMAVPVRANQKVLGAIVVYAAEDLRESDLRALEILSGLIGVSIENASLYGKLLGYASELEEEVRQRPAELDDTTGYLLKMKSALENEEPRRILRDRHGLPAELVSNQYSSLIPRKSVADESLPNTARLTAREIKVLELIAQGLTDKAIARKFVISPHTVNAHLRSIYRKLQTHSRTGAVDLARRRRIIY